MIDTKELQQLSEKIKELDAISNAKSEAGEFPTWEEFFRVNERHCVQVYLSFSRLLDELELKNADLGVLRSAQVVWKEQRTRLLGVLKEARAYREFMPLGDTFGAGKHSAMNHAAKRLHASLDSCDDIEPEVKDEQDT